MNSWRSNTLFWALWTPGTPTYMQPKHPRILRKNRSWRNYLVVNWSFWGLDFDSWHLLQANPDYLEIQPQRDDTTNLWYRCTHTDTHTHKKPVTILWQYQPVFKNEQAKKKKRKKKHQILKLEGWLRRWRYLLLQRRPGFRLEYPT